MIPGSGAAFASLMRKQLLGKEGITRIMQARRFTIIYSTDNPADSLFFLEAGLVRIVKRGADQKEGGCKFDCVNGHRKGSH